MKKRRTLIGILAAVLNLALIAMLIIYYLSGTEQMLLSVLLPSAVHITLCGTLLYFIFRDRDVTV